jgi:hypothetical protein
VIVVLRDAAIEAARQSKDGRVIYISLVEEGFVVAGRKEQMSAAIDISWRDLDANSGLLFNAVRLVASRLP